MQVYTNSPCAQVYTANGMKDKKYPFKGGVEQIPRQAICVETQRMPDAMNHDGFTKATLDVGETYDYTTVYKFAVK
jgi:aldose 1-epimerase